MLAALWLGLLRTKVAINAVPKRDLCACVCACVCGLTDRVKPSGMTYRGVLAVVCDMAYWGLFAVVYVA